jgi:hypothetical protein
VPDVALQGAEEGANSGKKRRK